jgi:MoaA/NifB/PqqE/SkfB family radical SAM enzyme
MKPKLLEIQLTGQCNLNCIYCGNSSDYINAGKIETEMAIKAIHELQPETILFTGGEAYLGWGVLLEILERLPKGKYGFILSSNLTLITEDDIDLLIDRYGFQTFHSSFNDLDDQMSAEIRGVTPRGRRNLMRNLSHISERGKKLKVETMMLPQIINRLKAINDLLVSLGVMHHKLEFLVPVGQADQDLALPVDVILDAIYNFYQTKHNDCLIEMSCFYASPCMTGHKLFDIDAEDFAFNKCVDGRESCYLLANGTPVPCFLFPDKEIDTNVKTDNLLTVWNTHPVFTGMRKSNEQCSTCGSYQHNETASRRKCNNGCAVWNYIATGSFGSLMEVVR